MSGAPAAVMCFGAADDCVEDDGDQRQHGDEADQLGRLKVLGEQAREIADARGRDVKLGQQHAEQHAGHAKPQAGEERRHHVREDDVIEDLGAACAHRAGAAHQDRIDLLHAGGDRDHDREHAVADAECDLRRCADTEQQHEQRQDRDLRQAIKQKNDRHEALMREAAQADGEPNGDADQRGEHKSDGDFVKRERERLRHARRGEQCAKRREHRRWRADEVAIEQEACGELPDADQQRDHDDPRGAGMREQPALERRFGICGAGHAGICVDHRHRA